MCEGVMLFILFLLVIVYNLINKKFISIFEAVLSQYKIGKY